jgi:hypothetical protein
MIKLDGRLEEFGFKNYYLFSRKAIALAIKQSNNRKRQMALIQLIDSASIGNPIFNGNSKRSAK